MPKNNPANEIKIVRELLNTYLAIRIGEGKYGWKELDLANPPAEGTIHDKLELTKTLFSEIPKTSIGEDPDEWITFIYNLANWEEKEHIIKEATASWPYGLGIGSFFIKDESLLERSLQAIRAFIVQEFNGSHFFANRKTELHKQTQELESELKIAKAARNGDPESIANLEDRFKVSTQNYKALVEPETNLYQNTFFTEEIMTRDQHKDKKGKPQLTENSFEDYCTNVMRGKRSPDLLNKLVHPKPPVSVVSPLQKHSKFSSPRENDAPNVTDVKQKKRNAK